jgi:hypothetical protein
MPEILPGAWCVETEQLETSRSGVWDLDEFLGLGLSPELGD